MIQIALTDLLVCVVWLVLTCVLMAERQSIETVPVVEDYGKFIILVNKNMTVSILHALTKINCSKMSIVMSKMKYLWRNLIENHQTAFSFACAV